MGRKSRGPKIWVHMDIGKGLSRGLQRAWGSFLTGENTEEPRSQGTHLGSQYVRDSV